MYMIAGHYTIQEVMKRTGLSRATIYNLEAKKIITFKRLHDGGRVYISLEQLEKALKP